MYSAIRRAVSAFDEEKDAQRHFDLAAERIQHVLLEVSIPAIPGMDLGVHAEPARLVGGDYIDVFCPTKECFVFGLGDASGKSLAAALNALMLRYLIRGLVSALGTKKLLDVVTVANSVITDDMTEESFITFILGAVEPATGSLRVVNAGHEPPLVLKNGSHAVQTMDVHGMVLGIDKEASYAEQEQSLLPGDIAVLYTDGLTEATNERGELYTIDRLKETLIAHRHLSAQGLADAVFNAVKAYAAVPLRDDATVFVIRRTE